MKLQPDRDEKGIRGYHSEAGAGTLENKDYRISVKQVRAGDEPGSPVVVKDLIEKGYVVLRLAIENRSDEKMTFNPVHTALTTDAFDYKKPLEYTDFYELSSGKNDRAREREAGEMKGRFYDLTLTINAGEKTSRLLIFPPLSGNSEKADLLIKDLYVGTGTRELYFPFLLEAD